MLKGADLVAIIKLYHTNYSNYAEFSVSARRRQPRPPMPGAYHCADDARL